MKNTFKLTCIIAFIAIIGFTALSLTGCDAGTTDDEKTVSVGTQTGTLTAGIAGTVTYAVTTENIADGSYTAAVESLPDGVTASSSIAIADNKGTLTLTGDTSTTETNADNLKLTLDGAKSAAFSLTISALGTTKIVSVGSQTGTLTERTAGTVTYTVTTANIEDESYTAEVANLPTGVTASSPIAIADNKGTLTLAGNTSTAAAVSNLTLTLDGTTSAVFTLIIDTKLFSGYVITGSGTTFTAVKNGTTVGTADQPIQTVIDAIKADAADEPCEIQLGNGTDTLDIGTANVTFDGTSGAWAGGITLMGKITSANTITTLGTILINNGASVTSMADIANTYNNINARTIYLDSTGTLTINSGTVSGTLGRAIFNNSTGTVNISGGTISATTGYAVYTSPLIGNNMNNTTINISGGTISATTGYAVYSYYGVTANISQESGKTTLITSANTNSTQGTIHFADAVTLQMTGGTVQNTATGATGNAINTAGTYSGTMTISGGTVSTTAASGYAVRSLNSRKLILDNSPAITGMLQVGIGNFSLGESFSTTDTYTIGLNTYTVGIAVANGASFYSHFTFVSVPPSLRSVVNGNDIVFVSVFNYTKTGTSYTITSGAGDGAGYLNAQSTVDAIKTDANGAACNIQFGDGTAVLDIFNNNIDFNNTTGTWGAITLKGKIRSAYNASTGIIAINDNVSITNEADISFNGSSNWNECTIRNNNSTEPVKITGGTLSVSAGNTVYNAGAAAITISGGTISATGIGYAIVNNSTGTVTISGGTVSASSGRAVSNNSTGTVNISGGTVSASSGTAVYSAAGGKINISQDAGKTTKVSSANTSATGGAIYISGTNAELTITNGTVENTSVNAATRNAIYITGTSVKADITGGTVTTASTSGNYAVYNSTVANAANIKVASACIPAGKNCQNVTLQP